MTISELPTPFKTMPPVEDVVYGQHLPENLALNQEAEPAVDEVEALVEYLLMCPAADLKDFSISEPEEWTIAGGALRSIHTTLSAHIEQEDRSGRSAHTYSNGVGINYDHAVEERIKGDERLSLIFQNVNQARQQFLSPKDEYTHNIIRPARSREEIIRFRELTPEQRDTLDYLKKVGACGMVPIEVFYPGDSVGVEQAKDICNDCGVRRVCLKFALEAGEDHGVWGGTSERERRRLQGKTW